MSYSKAVPAALLAAAIAAAGCGSSDTKSNNSSSPKPVAQVSTVAAKPVSVAIKVAAPTDGATVHTPTVDVRGVVTPQESSVQVLGREAKVVNGVFHAKARLQPGANEIDIEATANGAAPQTETISVTRGRSAAQIAKARHAAVAREARSRARQRAAAAARRAKANAPVAVPDLTGERLDVAEDDLHSAGLRATEIGGGTFGIVVKSNWTVCETRPGAGAQVKKHSRVKLIVDREC